MSDISENNRRIAKNTLMLYARMVLMMIITLYTSRVVLNTLGIEDYGIYNVVSGIVVMFSFINSSMSSATQRYLTFELGRGNYNKLNKVFITSVNIHFLISALVLILAETIGLWLLFNKMIIPEERLNTAFWIYQCSILSTIVMFISVPYNATIIAHEKMGVFAYISIVEAVLKLFIAYLLLLISCDKLLLYGVMILIVQVIVRIVYGVYCRKHFRETQYHFDFNKNLFKEMIVFSGWNLWGSMAVVTFTQGLNILLNVFFGPTVNAARAVAVQVQGAINQFSTNFQAALNPQITKSYARNDLSYMRSLIFRSSRFTYMLLICICLPVFLEADMLLKIWLNNVPDYSALFLRLIICITLIDAMSNPLMISVQASGKVKFYQSVIGGILLSILPLSYIVLKLGANPESVFIVHLFVCIIAFIVRLFIVSPIVKFSIFAYVKDVFYRCFISIIIAVAVPAFVKYFIIDNATLMNSIIVCFVSLISGLLSSFYITLTKQERTFIISKIKSVGHKNV